MLEGRAALFFLWPVVALASASTAAAEARAFRGAHPIDAEGHWHLVDEVHVHEELAIGAEAFGDVDGVRVFLGDPIAFGWTGDVWTYRGAHPLPGALSAYCGISGDHRHAFAPEGAYRRESGGTYQFAGGLRGGIPMVTPGRIVPRAPIAPRAPIVATPAMPVLGAWGPCVHQTVIGADGRPLLVASGACAPPPPAPVAPLRPAPTVFDGRYTSYRGVDGQGSPRTARPPRQRE